MKKFWLFIIPFVLLISKPLKAQEKRGETFFTIGFNSINFSSKYFNSSSKGGFNIGFGGRKTKLNSDHHPISSLFFEADISTRNVTAKGFAQLPDMSYEQSSFKYSYTKFQLLLGFEAFVIPTTLSFQGGLKAGSMTFTGELNKDEQNPFYLTNDEGNIPKEAIDAHKLDEKLGHLGWTTVTIPPFILPYSYDLFAGIGIGSGVVQFRARYNFGLLNLNRKVDKSKKIWERGWEFTLAFRLSKTKD